MRSCDRFFLFKSNKKVADKFLLLFLTPFQQNKFLLYSINIHHLN